jgi:AcrR family transcriptional regulator
VSKKGNSETRVPQILQSSIEIFRKEGAKGYSINRVAAHADIRLSTLQHYFVNRDALLGETIKALYSGYIEKYAQICEDEGLLPLERLDQVVDEMFDDILGDREEDNAFIIECWALAEREQLAKDVVHEAGASFIKLWHDLIHKINPALSDEERLTRAILIEAQGQGFSALTRHEDRIRQAEPELRIATKLYWRSLCTSTPITS